MLHGYGSNEVDLFMLQDQLPNDYFIIALRAPLSLSFGGYAWYPIAFMPDGSVQINAKDMHHAAHLVIENMNYLLRYFGFNDKANLLGFSQGSILSYLLLFLFPEHFKKTVAFSGYIHEPAMPEIPQGDTSDLKIFASHGVADEIIPVSLARQIPSVLSRHQIKHVYKEYDSGHYLIPENIKDASAFLENKDQLL